MIGMIVISKCGHDKGRLYVIIDDDGNGTYTLSDGKKRRICHPKKKKRIHCIPCANVGGDLSEAIACKTVTDKTLRGALAEYRSAARETLLCERRDSSAKG